MITNIIKYFGSKSGLSRQLGVDRSAVSQWIKRGAIPAAQAVKIEILSCGTFKTVEILNNWAIESALINAEQLSD